jgi:hypothetical protein
MFFWLSNNIANLSVHFQHSTIEHARVSDASGVLTAVPSVPVVVVVSVVLILVVSAAGSCGS